MNFKKFTIYSILFVLAFVYCFGIGTFVDYDMKRYFIDGFYMANYGVEGIKGYPNKLFSIFLGLGYKLTDGWYGLSNILFFPLYLFGVYSLYKVLNYFIQKDYISLLFTLVFLLIDRSSDYAIYFYSYMVYFFFFISIIYLSLYFPTKIYLIGLYFAVGSLFRNQIATFLPFVALIINHYTNYKNSKVNLLKTIFILLVSLIIVHVGYELLKKIIISEQSYGVNFKYYKTELYVNLLRPYLFSYKGIKLFLTSTLSQYYFYLVVIPCFFMFNKKIINSEQEKASNKPLLLIFLILALFIYFMPAIMYIKQGLREGYSLYYFGLLSRYSFIMIPLLIPIYHFILKEQTIIKLKPKVIYLVMLVLLMPILTADRLPILLKNTFTNLSHKNGLYGADNTKLKEFLKK